MDKIDSVTEAPFAKHHVAKLLIAFGIQCSDFHLILYWHKLILQAEGQQTDFVYDTDAAALLQLFSLLYKVKCLLENNMMESPSLCSCSPKFIVC